MFAGCFATSAADAAFTVSGSTVTSDGGAATITIAGNYASKTVQLLTVTIPDGLSFDSVTDMDPYVEGSEEDFGYVASTNADTGVTTVKFLEAYTGDFSIVINVTADANTTDADVTYTIDASADVADWDATEVTSVQTTGSITVPAKKAEVVEPEDVLDENITNQATVSVTNTINIRFLMSNIPECDDFYVVVERDKCDIDYNFLEEKYTYTIYKNDVDMKTASNNRYYFYYRDLGMYELNFDVVATIYCLDENDNIIYHSNPTTANVVTALKDLYAADNSRKFAADLIYLADAAQVFAVGDKDCDLANVELPAKGFTGVGSGKVAKEDLVAVAAEDQSAPEVDGVSVAYACNFAGNPAIRYILSGCASYENLKMNATYTSVAFGDSTTHIVSKDYTLSDFSSASNDRLLTYFRDLALCDTNKIVTITIYDGDTLLFTGKYSLETYVYAVTGGSSAVAPVFDALASFGVSAREYFEK